MNWEKNVKYKKCKIYYVQSRTDCLKMFEHDGKRIRRMDRMEAGILNLPVFYDGKRFNDQLLVCGPKAHHFTV